MRIEEVLQIKEQMLGDYSVQAVDGRSLWEALGVKREFSKWIKEKILEAEAENGKDYSFAKNGEALQNARIDYTLSLPLAKDIAMLTKGEPAKAVRSYFRECEKTVQKQVQHSIDMDKYGADANKRFMQELHLRIDVLELVVKNPSIGSRVAAAIEAQTLVAQETGVTVELPNDIYAHQVESNGVTFDKTVETAFAARVAIGSTVTNVSTWAKQFKHITSTHINKVLIEHGYAYRLNLSQVAPTTKGSEFCNTTIGASGKSAGKLLVKGWNLSDKRFTDVVSPILEELEDYLHQEFIIKRKK